MIDDPRVKAVTLTGSEPAGRQVAAQAGTPDQEVRAGTGRQRSLHRDAQRRSRRRGAHRRAGARHQQRPKLHRRQALHRGRGASPASSSGRFVEAMDALVVGDPMQEATQVGPLATPVILHELDEQVRRSVAAGARVLTGGAARRAARQFLCAHRAGGCARRFARLPRGVVRTRGRADARSRNRRRRSDWPTIRHSDSEPARGPAMPPSRSASSSEIEAGMVFINGMVASDPRLPFGGVKASGLRTRTQRLGHSRIRQREISRGARELRDVCYCTDGHWNSDCSLPKRGHIMRKICTGIVTLFIGSPVRGGYTAGTAIRLDQSF